MRALLLIDIQNDFLPGGTLAVPEGDKIIPIANQLIDEHELVFATQDWHPADHGSFAVNHPGKEVFDQIDLNGLPQTLWPVHCVQGTPGAEFADELNSDAITEVFVKGTDSEIDSYSGFYDNGHRRSTGLSEHLKSIGVDELTVCGLATDYCVKFTVLDALRDGFKIKVHLPACRGVNIKPDDVEIAIEEMRATGAIIKS